MVHQSSGLVQVLVNVLAPPLSRPGSRESLVKENIWSETPFHAACTHGRNKVPGSPIFSSTRRLQELISHLLNQANISVHIQVIRILTNYV